MDNIALFGCGLAVTLMSGMGILVYMVHVGYEDKRKALEQKKKNEDRIKEKIDADLGAVSTLIEVKVTEMEPESIIEICSVS